MPEHKMKLLDTLSKNIEKKQPQGCHNAGPGLQRENEEKVLEPDALLSLAAMAKEGIAEQIPLR